MKQVPFTIGGHDVAPGKRALIDLPLAKLSTHTPVTLPVHVVHGRKPGPTLFVCAAIHGDEVIGVEIIRRLLSRSLKPLSGTLLCVPIVNAFGFISQSRYLPDRRDLNRSFPGSARGSLGGQIANLFMDAVVARSDMGIDLHTGAVKRSNLPQLRADFTDEKVRDVGRAFGAPLMLQSGLREGSLRGAAQDVGVPVLVYEAGEALRLDELSIRIGVKGIVSVMRKLGMLRPLAKPGKKMIPVMSNTSGWIRADHSGIFATRTRLGEHVEKGERLGVITNPYDGEKFDLTARFAGIVIGRSNVSIVNRGDALFHLASVASPDKALDRIGEISDVAADSQVYEDENLV